MTELWRLFIRGLAVLAGATFLTLSHDYEFWTAAAGCWFVLITTGQRNDRIFIRIDDHNGAAVTRRVPARYGRL